MKRILTILLFVLALAAGVAAQSNPPLRISEVDGSPSKTNPLGLKFPNGTLSVVNGIVIYTPASGVGLGTVTNLSVVTANGVSGSVATSTSTPAITITLGAITPTSVNGNFFTTGSSTYTGSAGRTYTFPTTSATIARTDAAQSFIGVQTFVAPILGTPTSATLTNATGLPPTTGIVGWPANASGVLTNNGSGTLSWAAAGGGSGTVTNIGGNLTLNALMLGAGTTDSKVLASLGTTTTVLHGNAAGVPSFAAVSLTADVSGILPAANGGSGINNSVTLNFGAGGTLGSNAFTSTAYVPTSTTVNAKALSSNITLGLASADFVNQGTTTTVLHGNAAGNPSFAGVSIADHTATGTPSSSTFLRGDNTWATPAGSGTVTATGGALTLNAVTLGAGGTDTKVLASLGTTTTLLHGNAAGVPSFAGVAIADLTATGTPSSTTFLRGDNTWAAPSGSGTVTVVSAGTLTSTALITGGGSQALQTPSATATLDSSGNISTPGTASFGVGGSVAGALELAQGTAPSAGTNSVKIYAPASVATSYVIALPGAAGTGLGHYANSAGVVTMSISGVSIADHTATGTPSSSTFLRGDNTWATPAGSGTVTATAGALTLNAVVLGAGTTDTKVLASLGTTTTLLHGNAAGVPSFAGVSIADHTATGTPSSSTFLRGDNTWATPAGSGTVTNTGGNLTLNALMLGAGTTDSKVLASLGTTTTLLHGNAAGVPSFAVVTPSDASGNTSGSGNFVLVTSATLITPALGTPSALVLTNATGLPPTTGIVGWPSNASGVLTNNGSGTLTWGAGGSGSAWDAITPPSGNDDINFGTTVQSLTATTALAGATTDILTLNHLTSATPLIGQGVRIVFGVETSGVGATGGAFPMAAFGARADAVDTGIRSGAASIYTNTPTSSTLVERGYFNAAGLSVNATGAGAGATGEIRLNTLSNTSYVGIKPADSGTSWTMTLPGTAPSGSTAYSASNWALSITSGGVVTSVKVQEPISATSPLTLSSGVLDLGVVGVGLGGTNIASYVAGDTIYASGTTTLTALAKGTALQYYRMNAGATAPEWATLTALTDPMTTRGDIIVRNASNVTARLAVGGASTFLMSNGTDLMYSAVDLATAEVAGILPGANGGTGNGFFAVTGPTTSLKTMTFPNASATIARTDAAQTFTGVQSMTSPAITTSLTSPSTTFALLNVTSTTINFAGNASVALNIGNASGSTSMLGILGVDGATPSSSTALIVPASTTGVSSLRIPHGSAPTSPVNGDLWTTTSGLNVRINGSTVLLGTGGGGGDALVANPLSQFASTTSAQLAGVISNETGSSLLVFNTSPTLVTPILGVASGTSFAISGTAGAGFNEYPTQSSAPSASASGYRQYADSTGRMSWIRQADGFTRTWDATLTANRVYTLFDASDTIVGRATADTLTNKRITPRTSSITSNATWSPNADTDDLYLITAQAAAATTISNPSGTPTAGQRLIIRVKDDGTARALTWSGSQWRASSDLALPTTTTISKTLYLGFIWNAVDSKWDLLAKLDNF